MPWAQVPAVSRSLRAVEVEELSSLLAPGVRTSRGLGQTGRLFFSTFSSNPGGAPPRGTRRVRPLHSPAEATVTPPPAQNPHPPTPPQGRVGGRGGGGGGAGGGTRAHLAPPRSRPMVGPRPLPGPQRRRRTSRAREAAPRLPAKESPRLPAHPKLHCCLTSRHPRFALRGRGGKRPWAEPTGACFGWGRGSALLALPVSVCVGRGGARARARVGEFGGSGGASSSLWETR